MSKQLFEFVKVAAGEPFKWPTGNYSYNYTGKLDSTVYYDDFVEGKTSKNDVFILRTAESADAEREGFSSLKALSTIKRKIVEICNKNIGWGHTDDTENVVIVKPSAGDEIVEFLRKETEQFLKNKRTTPADPGSQVEAGKFAEWAALNGWTYNKIWEAWHNADALPSKIVPTASLITLYKQSL